MKKNVMSDALRSGLNKTPGKLARVALWVLATAVFFVFARYARYVKIEEFSGFKISEMQGLSGVIFGAIFALTYAVQLCHGKKLPAYMHVLLAVITGAILLGKISLLDYMSDDYEIFLSNWIYEYSQMGLKEGLGRYIGSDYTPPYLYLMQLVSRVKDYPGQYLVKAISIAFDTLMAYGVMKIASIKVKGTGAQLMIFHIATMLPTVVFNSAYWGQCDVIYVSLCLLAVYMGMTSRSARSMIFFGMALSFKLQTVFFLPIMLPLWLRRQIKLRHLVLIPAAYMGMMIPALWGGKSLHHVLTVYMQQAGQYKFLSMNAPNWYQLLPDLGKDVLYNMFNPMAMALGFACVMAMCALVTIKRNQLSDDATALICLMMLSGIPYFLPQMHERYTYGADVLSLAVAAYAPGRRYLLPLCFGFASYVAYTAGLAGEQIMHLRWAAMFQGAGIALTAAELWRSLQRGKDEAVIQEVKA